MTGRSFDHRRGYVNDDIPPGRPTDAKAPYVDHGTDVHPAAPHYTREEMDREWTYFWPRVWTLAGRESDCAAVGDFFTYGLGRESFVIVRSAPDRLQAFHNVCQHRGNLLVHKECGSAERFVCGFHSWTYGLDGTLAKVTDQETFRPEVLRDRAALDLAEVRCETWAGFVFVNMDREAKSLKEFLGVLPEHFAPYRLEAWSIQSDAEMEWNANWKTGVDAFIEVYHSHRVHHELEVSLEAKHCQQDCYPHGHSRSVVPFGVVSQRIEPRPGKLNELLAFSLQQFEVDPAGYQGPPDDIRRAMVRAKRAWAEKYGLDYVKDLSDWQLVNLGSYFVFPNTTINVLPESVLVQRWRPNPTDPERLTYDVVSLLPPVGSSEARLRSLASEGRREAVFRAGELPNRPERLHTQDATQLGFVLNQDFYAIPKVQQGLRSAGFHGMRFSEQEVRLRHYRKEMERYRDDPGYMRAGA